MKQEEKRERTKRLLLEAAKASIREKGCTGATLSDIMERSGLSKGAIFHYVKSKDELFAWVLLERMEETNRRFYEAARQRSPTFEAPMQAIIAGLPGLDDPADLGSQVLMYLLGKSDVPEVKEVLDRYYEQALRMAALWIEAGQEAGVIPQTVPASKTAELFMLIAFGFRMRSAVRADRHSFGIADFANLMVRLLQPKD